MEQLRSKGMMAESFIRLGHQIKQKCKKKCSLTVYILMVDTSMAASTAHGNQASGVWVFNLTAWTCKSKSPEVFQGLCSDSG